MIYSSLIWVPTIFYFKNTNVARKITDKRVTLYKFYEVDDHMVQKNKKTNLKD